jgi:hypothetical protein
VPEPNQQATPDATMHHVRVRWNEALAGLRDVLIIAVGFLYTLGLLTWSLSALEMYIGFIQAFDAQYIVAGFIPAVLIVLIYAFMSSRARQSYTLRRYYRDLSPLLFIAFATLFALDLFLREMHNIIMGRSTLGLFGYLERLNPSLDNFIWYVICLALTLNVLQWPWADPPAPSSSQRIARISSRINYYSYYFKRSIKVSVCVLPCIFLVLAVREYVYGVFPNMPQEIGGGQPRCALLHVKKGEIAATTAQAQSEKHAVVPQEISDYGAVRPTAEGRLGLADTDKVVQTKEVRVVYHSDKSVFFQIPSKDHKLGSNQGIFEVKRDAIPAIIWLRSCSGAE